MSSATYLASRQGFFVQSNLSGGTISFAGNSQEHQSETFLEIKQRETRNKTLCQKRKGREIYRYFLYRFSNKKF